MKLNMYQIIKEPVITEKMSVRVAQECKETKKYAFSVHPDSNKKQVKAAVEKIFNVHVTKVNMMNNPGKWRRVRYQPGLTAEWKKAIVTLKKGEEIDITSHK